MLALAAGIIHFATVMALAYLLVAIGCVIAFGRKRRPSSGFQPPVTILKPLCGLDRFLHENIRSFAIQDYPAYQVIFGVRDAEDPAIPIAKRVIDEFPDADLALVIDGGVVGSNLKVSNLANMYREAKHEIIVIADSDMRVDPSYLNAVVAPFADESVGAVTCLYRGTPTGGLASSLGALFINDWFLPSVLVALVFQRLRFCFGATMAVRRGVLEEIGGLERLSAYLADDYMLGRFVGERGYRVRLSHYIVENIVGEPDFKTLFYHELRWARTVRACQPLGYAFLFIAHNAISLSILSFFMLRSNLVGAVGLGLALALRLALHGAVRTTVGARRGGGPWLIPLRDALCLVVWAVGLAGRSVRWREREFALQPDGQVFKKGARNP